MNKILKDIDELIKSDPSIDSIVDQIQTLVSIAPISNGSKFNPGVELYRSTNFHKYIPSNISELWFPPKEFAKLSRANRDDSPIFYCSSDPMCSHLEIGMQPGQLAVMSKWMTTKEMILHDLGYTYEVFKRSNSYRSVPEANLNFQKYNFTDIHNYIHLAFTQSEFVYYKLTAAIAEVHLRGDFISGIRYPAITKNSNVDNLALKPEFVTSSLELTTSQLIRIEQINKSTNALDGEIIADLKSVSKLGELVWEFRCRERAIDPGESFTLSKGIHIIRSPAEIMVDGKCYHLEPGFSIEVPQAGDVIIRNLKGEEISSN
ncbi:MAG: hypothetical protein KBF59_09690 [Ignavibacterium sp.]|jgi:hypothetical protein|nr:hypothetical protein [Ignavibacterium sp.]